MPHPHDITSPTGLESRLRAVAPHALLVSESVVRRVARQELGVSGAHSFVPHTHALALRADALARAIPPDELGPTHPHEGWVLLLARPEEDTLRQTWRRLFHARIDETLGRLVEAGHLSPARVRALIDRLGQVPMDEARAVLLDEGLITSAEPTRDLIEFIALHEELRHFAPELLPHTFPSLVGRDEVRTLIDALVPPDLINKTRLEGSDAPSAPLRPKSPPHPATRESAPPLLAAARRATRHGRDADAAQYAWRARHASNGVESSEAQDLEDHAVRRLAARLEALAGPADASSWTSVITALLPFARGMRSVEGRLLHDLQRACDDGGAPLWSLDLGRAARSFLRRPARQREDALQRVVVARHIARALARLPSARLSETERRRCVRTLGSSARHFELLVRDELGGLLTDALTHTGLTPGNVPETVARDKLVAELCDTLLARGFLSFPDLRDRIAQSQLKLDDLIGPGPRLRRDSLMRLDRHLRDRLGGAYRPAEVYRRFFHRASALVFAHPAGRTFVRYVALPFGGAFILVKGFDLVVLSLIATLLGLQPVPPPPGAPAGTPHEHALQVFSLPLWAAVGVTLLLLLHVPRARALARAAARRLFAIFRFLFMTLPARLRALPWVDWLARTRAVAFARDHLVRPTLYALPVTLIAVALTGDTRLWLWLGVPLTLVWSVFFATRAGRRLIELTRDALLKGWRDLRHDVVPRLIAAVLDLFKGVVDRVEVLLYVVDQRLRYHRGDSAMGTALRGVLGLLWSALAYVIRLLVNLVAEPQLNPIKHFPVVTIAHKVTIPWSIAVHQSLRQAGMSEAMASMIGLGAFQLVVPGIAGFLVWELKENWRLYRANRRPELGPVIVGSHGEPLYRLLRPGFHSGTIPTLFRKLRRAERLHAGPAARQHLEALRHIEEAVERFVEREVKALLVRSEQLPEATSLTVARVTLTPARITLDLELPALDPRPLRLAFEEQSDLLLAELLEPGFLPALGAPTAQRRVAFVTALLGLYKLAGVDLVREHLAAALPEGASHDISHRGLVVWQDQFARELTYPLHLDAPALTPTEAGPPIPTAPLTFRQRSVRWDAWCQAWTSPDATRALRDQVLGAQLLLPAPPDPSVTAPSAREDSAPSAPDMPEHP